MTASEIRKSFVILATIAIIIISSLIVLPFIEDPIKDYVAAFFMKVEKEIPKPKETVNTNTEVKTPTPTATPTASNQEISNVNGNTNGNVNSILQPSPTVTPTPTPTPTPAATPSPTPKETPNSIIAEAEAQAIPTEYSKLAVNLLTNFFRIVKVLLWFILIVAFIRFVNSVIFARVFRNASSYELTSLIRNVVVVLIYIISFFIIFQSQYPGIDLTALFTGSTIIGIVVGLALQDTLGNLFSGLALQADQPFVLGDVVSIPSKGTGVVESISWRGVKIRTFQNKLLVIGNSILGKETIEVAPKNNLNARLVHFNTLYTDSPAKTIQVVREAVRQVENVSTKIRPIVRIRDLAESGIDWEIKYWLEDYSKYNTTDALIRQRVWYAFRRENINFAYPTRTLYMEKSEPEEKVVETENTIYERIKNVDIFAPLNDEETEKLTDAAHLRVFAPDEAIVQKGQPGGSMFVVHKGTVEIQTVDDQGKKQVVGILREGDFFGEMGLLTGEPRSATVVAKEETQVLQIGKFCLKPILDNNPNLIKTLSRIIEERRELLTEKEHQGKEKVSEQDKNVFKSIRKFFGLN